MYYAKCTIHCKCGFPIPCPWTFVYLKGKRCILNWPVARLWTFFCQITNTHLISMLYTVRLNYAECYFELHKLFWCIAYYQGPLYLKVLQDPLIFAQGTKSKALSFCSLVTLSISFVSFSFYELRSLRQTSCKKLMQMKLINKITNEQKDRT